MWNLILLILFIGIVGVILFNAFHKEENNGLRLYIISVSILITLVIIINNILLDKGSLNRFQKQAADEIIHTMPPERNLKTIVTVPKDIYICYKTKDLPPYVALNWEKLNPGYKVQIYDDKDCEEFLLHEYGQTYAKLFKSIPDGPIRADFWRICMIYARGGVYTDADVEPLVPMKDFVNPNASFVICMNPASKVGTNPHFMVATPKHPILKICMDIYLKMYKEGVKYSYWGWSITGIMYKTMKKYIPNFEHREGLQKGKYGFIIQILKEITFSDPTKDYIMYKGIKVLNNRYKSYSGHQFN